MTHANLYVVCATVIPVLLLTGSLQAALYRRYIEHMSEPMALGRHRRRSRWPRWAVNALAIVMVLTAILGELTALHALVANDDTLRNRSTVWSSAALLFCVVAVAVGWEIVSETNRPSSDE